MPAQDFEPSTIPMSKVAIGNVRHDEKAVEAIRAETEKRHKPGKKADSDAWTRTKNKALRRKMARQRMGGIPGEMLHERKKGR